MLGNLKDDERVGSKVACLVLNLVCRWVEWRVRSSVEQLALSLTEQLGLHLDFLKVAHWDYHLVEPMVER